MRNLMNLKKLFRTLLIITLLMFPMGTVISASNSATISDIEIAPAGSIVTINLNGTVNTKVFNLVNPERWVMDISPAKWSNSIERRIDISDSNYFTQIRTGQWQQNTARLVIHTSGRSPVVESKDNQIVIIFDESAISMDKVYDGMQPLPVPVIEKFVEDDTRMKQDESADDSETISELRAVRPTVKFSGRKGQVEEVGFRVSETDADSQKPDLLSKPEAERSIDKTESSTEIKTQVRTKDTEDFPFEILTDGDITIIKVDLGSQRSYDIRRGSFPDRLIIEYPSRATLYDSKPIQYKQADRERVPIGILSEYSRFISESPSGYNRLAFFAEDDFEYKTLLEKNTLKIAINAAGKTAELQTALETRTDRKPSTDVLATDIEASPVVQIPSARDSEAEIETETETVATQITESKPTEHEEIESSDTKSFRIDIDDTGHTTPQIGTSFILKEVETDSAIQASAKDMLSILPDIAERSTASLKKSDVDLASGPLMFDPPESLPPLPKGTRPAADLFLTTGESVIVPTKNLVRASVGDPEVITVNVLTQEEILITAKGEGQTTLILWEDGIGRSVRWVNVGRNTLLKTIDVERVINNPAINVHFLGESTLVLEGKVATEEEINRAVKIAGGAADKVVNLLEMTAPKQVLVKVRFVEIQSKDKDEFLNQFGSGTRTEAGDFQFNILSDIMNPEMASGGIFDISLHPGIVKGRGSNQRFDPLDFMFTWLEQNRKGKVLSQPNIVTLSNHEAHFRVGGEVPYTYQSQEGVNVVNFREFGVELTVTPNVDSQNNINMKVKPVVRMPDFTLAIGGVPGFKTREVETNIQVADGQTIVIGGLLQQEEIDVQSKVPLFGDMPLVGKLFTSKSKTYEETELLVFLTPMLLKDIWSVEESIRSDDDISLSPYYQEEFIGSPE